MSLTCKEVMVSNQIILRPTDTVKTAFQLMRKKGVRFLPVVDDNGKYLGVFTSPTLIKLLLPRAMTIELGGNEEVHQALNDLKFYHVNKETFHSSLAEEKNESVMNHLSEPDSIPVVSPDTSVMEGVLLLHKFKRHVIVVEPNTDKFIGVVSINSVLKEIFDEDCMD